MNVLLLGGTGRCGSRVLAQLLARGVPVSAPDSMELDLTRMHMPRAWQPWLDGADVVIHAAGILRERGADTFAAHRAAACALAQACAGGGPRHVIALSAAGANAGSDVPWFAARGAADDALVALALPVSADAPAAPFSSEALTPRVTIVRAGALYLDADGRARRFHPQALTLDWRAATGSLPLTSLADAAAVLVRAALSPAPSAHAVIDLAEPSLARAA